MQQIQLSDQLYQDAKRRASEAGYSNVDQYIADVLVHDLTNNDGNETPNLDHLFTPEVIADLDQISAEIKAGGKIYSLDEVQEHFEKKRKEWLQSHAG
jgi:hypothetical protein